MFTVEGRERVSDRVLELAASDSRIVAAAVVGSLADGEGDRWSDLDLTFAVADGVPLVDVLDEWTRVLAAELDAIHLFDLPSGPALYRVLLLPGCLQVDVSVSPAAQFAAGGARFRLLFGSAGEPREVAPPAAEELFGYAVHHALRARFSIERGRYWQAEYWLSGVRDHALGLACRRRGLPASHGRGFDDLPEDALRGFEPAIARSLERAELLRALAAAVDGLLREAAEVESLAARVAPRLRELTAEWRD